MFSIVQHKYSVILALAFGVTAACLLAYVWSVRRKLVAVHRSINILSKEVHDLRQEMAASSTSSSSPKLPPRPSKPAGRVDVIQFIDTSNVPVVLATPPPPASSPKITEVIEPEEEEEEADTLPTPALTEDGSIDTALLDQELESELNELK